MQVTDYMPTYRVKVRPVKAGNLVRTLVVFALDATSAANMAIDHVRNVDKVDRAHALSVERV